MAKNGPGRDPTRDDVARLAGVSPAVVSYVINDGPRPVAPSTKTRVLEAVATLGYRPNASAQALSRGSSDLVGLVVPDLLNPYFASLAHELETAATDEGLSVLVADGNGDDAVPLVRQLAGRKLRGIVVAAAVTPALARELLASGVPHMVLNQLTRTAGLTSLRPDYYAGAVLAMEHLVTAHGHRSVAYINGPGAFDDERGAAWRDFQRSRDLPPAPRVSAEFSPAGGYQAARKIVAERPDVTAMFVASDQQATGVLLALDESGRPAPEHMAVVSLDGAPASAYTVPPLTTVQVPIAQMARDAVTGLLTGEHPQVEYEPRLVVRRSCGCTAPPEIPE